MTLKTGNNGLIEPECCSGPACCFSEQIQCFCLHVQSVLLNSWFGFRVFIAIRLLVAGIQINPDLPSPWGHPRHPPSSASAMHPTRSLCLSLSFNPHRQPPAGYPAGSGPLGVEQTRHHRDPPQAAPSPAAGAAGAASSSSPSKEWTFAIQRVLS